MKILFVGMANSIHVVRWIKQIEDVGWDLHLVPCEDIASHYWHPELSGVTVHTSVSIWNISQENLERRGTRLPLPRRSVSLHAEVEIRKLMRNYRPRYWARHLARVIAEVQPDILHIIEMQHSGYLMLEALPHIKTTLPPVIYTNWGNDIYLFHNLDDHLPKIKAFLDIVDYYDCECERDIHLAQSLGYTGKTWPVFPNTGGHHLERLPQFWSEEKVSQRRVIMLKGYQHWQGRSLFAIKALELVADLLEGYTVAIFSLNGDVRIAGELFSKRTGVQVEFVSGVSHEEMMRLFGRARIYLCSNITDGLNTAFGEAITMGAFPVISGTACVDEWITDGETGLIIQDPHMPVEIAEKLRRALTDDDLVDQAAAVNWQTAQARLDFETIRAQTIELYQSVMADK